MVSSIPVNPSKPYDMKEIIRAVVDDRHFFEVHEHFAANLIVWFARLGGRPVGVVASQPSVLAGCLDIHASIKGARFVRFCDAFNIPLLTFVDVPGFLPGADQEWRAIITRKAYGGAYDVMASKHLRADVNLPFPAAEIAVMGPEGAVNIVFRKDLAQAGDPEAERERLVAEYREKFANPYKAAELGYLDDVIRPEDTRPRVVRAFEMLRTKRQGVPNRKHGNIPL